MRLELSCEAGAILRPRFVKTVVGLALAVGLALGPAAAGSAFAASAPSAAAASAASAGSWAAGSARASSVSVAEACPPAPVGYARCALLRRTDIAPRPAGIASPATPSGLAPADLVSAYALPSTTAGAGLTVAIVGAYDLPTAEADMAVYRAQFSLPACTAGSGCFRKVDQNGGTAYPSSGAGTGWDSEAELDLDMVSAICPNCSILLVEADDNQIENLGRGVDTAVSMGAIAVSNSYTAAEWPGATSLESRYDHPGVAITAASGDNGYAGGVNFPASSPHVVGVGGTTLTADGSTRGWTETVWAATGSGCSTLEAKPFWQTDGACPTRTVADIAAVADPATGIATYDPGHAGWGVAGGTSVGSPIIAAIFALAGGPAAGSEAPRSLYAQRGGLWDVTSGSNGSCGSYLCTAGAGFDGPTGLGTPNGVAAFAPLAMPGATYEPLAPNRLVDSRAGTRLGLTASLASGHPVSFQVTNRRPGNATNVPTGAAAVTGNLTAVNESSAGYFTLSPTNPGAHPTTSSLNFPRGDIRADNVSVELGGGGILWIEFVGTSGAKADVIFDVTGYFTPALTGKTYVPVKPDRLVDSRAGTRKGLAASVISGTPVSFKVDDVPGSAVAVTGNLTAVNETSKGYFTLTPTRPSATPGTSNLNFPKGDVRANGATVALGSGGVLWVTFIGSGGAKADVVFDLTGYFTADASGLSYVPVAPNRLCDSRTGSHVGMTRSLVTGAPASFVARNRVPGDSMRNVPTAALAVTGNLTAVNETSPGYFTVTPESPTGTPPTSTVNFPKGDIRANGAAIALGSDGKLWVTFVGWPGAHADVIFDVTGYFTR